MVALNESLLTIIRSVEATMQAAGLALASAKAPEDTAEPVVFASETASAELSFDGCVMTVKCKADGRDEKTVAEILFNPEEEDWDDRANKSAANAVNEAVAGYFGTELVFAGKATKAPAKQPGTSDKVIDITEIAEKKAKKDKNKADTYDEISLAGRMETIFPDLKGEMVKNINKYDIFLPEEYFETLVTPKIFEAVKLNDRPVLKKVFNAFNVFYNEGENEMQSLIVVSILGMGFAKDDSGFANCECLMDDTLKDALTPVIDYLKTAPAKKRIDSFEHPVPNANAKAGKKKLKVK